MNNRPHEEVKSLDEAARWFLRNPSGAVLCVCVATGEKQLVRREQSFEDVIQFFAACVLVEIEKLK